MQSTVLSDTAVYRNALPAGAALMEYRLEGVLGAGGFGMTYVAWDAHLHKRVAIKEYLPGDIALRALDGSIVPVATQRQDDYRSGLERFLLEARTLARFSHPHIVRVIRYFEANGTAYMVMDYEQGESMNRYLEREPYPSEDRLAAILLPLLDGLRAVHEAGFLHRDIKPSNIFIREQGGPVLLDFGAARHTVAGSGNYTALLTPGYAPIEQYSAEAKQGPWSDIYALAGVFFRAVTDAHPPDAVARMRRDTVAQALADARGRYGEPFLAAIGWALEKDEHRRPQSVAEWQEGLTGRLRIPYSLSDALSEAPDEAPTRVATPSQPKRLAASRMNDPRYRWLLPAAVVVIALAVLFSQRRADRLAEPVAPVPTAAPSASAEKPVELPQASSKPRPAPKSARQDTRPVVQRASPTAAAREVEEPAASDEPIVEGERAPVRDAVALPPLVEGARDRPGRERSARPGSER